MADRLVDVFISVGSNLEPERNIAGALARLQRSVVVTGVSTFYWTAPLGRPEQPRFLNGVWRIRTGLPPRTLKFDVLRVIETDLGRIRGPDKYAARTIDLDVLLYGDIVLTEPDLRIPDPDLQTRPFLAIPLLELSPEVVLPDSGEALATMVGAWEQATMEPALPFTRHLRERILLATGDRSSRPADPECDTENLP